MLKMDFSGLTSSVNANISDRFQSIVGFFALPYLNLGKQMEQAVKSFTISQEIKWEYIREASTGLVILKAEKDSESLNEIRQIADELFK